MRKKRTKLVNSGQWLNHGSRMHEGMMLVRGQSMKPLINIAPTISAARSKVLFKQILAR